MSDKQSQNKEAPLIVRCPTCRKSVRYDVNNEFRPFCSRTCSDHDIIAWANEDYSIAGRPAEPEEIAAELTKDQKD